MIRVGILGATGYTAAELIRLLQWHPHVTITRLTSRDDTRPHVSEVHPQIRGLDCHLAPLDVEDFADSVDFVFSCLPHAASAASLAPLLDAGLRAIDFSADYRLDDRALFERWYGVTHPDPDRVGHVPYGLPELFRESIAKAEVVANPGCFPTSFLLPMGPLLQQGIIAGETIIVDSKTGVSGAGRKAHLSFHFPECNESVTAYGVGKHRHAPEMVNLASRFSGHQPRVLFTPHLIPMDRGILSTIYLPDPADRGSADRIRECLAAWYADEPFVELVDSPPATKHVSGTNRCHLYVGEVGGTPLILSAIDNLLKGASGAAVQNFNLMNSFRETEAIQP